MIKPITMLLIFVYINYPTPTILILLLILILRMTVSLVQAKDGKGFVLADGNPSLIFFF